MAKFPNGDIRKYGKFERYGLSYKRHYEHDYVPPVNSDSNSFKLSTSKGIISNVVNVRANKDFTYAIQTENGKCKYVKEIYDAKGGLYTVCVKHDSNRSYSSEEITTYKKHTGVYETDDSYVFIGNPIRAGPHKAPSKSHIDKDSVIDMHIKKPNGEIIRSLPEYVMYGEQDIPTRNKNSIPSTEINTNITKDNLSVLISARLYGSLEPSLKTGSDFYSIIEAYPELEKFLRYIDTYNQFYCAKDKLSYSYTKEELQEIRELAKYNLPHEIKENMKLQCK